MMIGKPGNQVVGNQRCRARGKWGLWASLSVQLPMEQCNSGMVQQCNSATVQYCSSASVPWCNMQRCNELQVHIAQKQGSSKFTLEEAQCTIILPLCETNWEHVHCAPFSHFSIDVIPDKFDAFSPSHFRRQQLTNLYLIPSFFFF